MSYHHHHPDHDRLWPVLVALVIALATFLFMCLTPAGASAQGSLLDRYTVPQPAQLAFDAATFDTLTAGIDTATHEHAFCLIGHVVQFGDTTVVAITRAYSAPNEREYRDSVVYDPCPPGAGSAHWHLKHLGHAFYPSMTDILDGIDHGEPFAMLVNEDGIGVYLIDQRQLLHLPGATR